MSKRNKFGAFMLTLVIVLATASAVSADPPGGGWWTAQQIQATGGDNTTVQLTAYTKDATASPSSYDCGNKVLNKGEAFVYVPTSNWGITPNCGALPSGFQGSAVVSADKEVVAIVEETNQSAAPLGTSGGTADAAYRGIGGTETATELRFPAYKSNHAGETSTFYIQNAGGSPTRLQAVFQECSATTPGCTGTGKVYTYTLSTALQPNRMAVIMPADATGMPSGSGKFGGVTITSLDGQALAGVVNEHATTASGAALYLKATRAFTPSEYDGKLYAPVVKKTYPNNSSAGSKWSALQIQNVGGTLGNFVITYKIASGTRAGTALTDNTTCVNIAPGQTCFVMTLFPVAGSGTAQLQNGEYAAATVTGNVNMVAVVNEETIYSYSPASGKQFATYSAVPNKFTSMRVSVPAYKEEWVGRYMGVTVMNVGGGSAVITATVKNASKTPAPADLVAKSSSVTTGNAMTFWLLSRNQAQSLGGVSVVFGTPANFITTNNSLSLESNQPIAVIINQEDSYLNPPAVKMDAASYEGFPLP